MSDDVPDWADEAPHRDVLALQVAKAEQGKPEGDGVVKKAKRYDGILSQEEFDEKRRSGALYLGP